MNSLPHLSIPSLTPWQSHILTLSNKELKEEYAALEFAVKSLAVKMIQTANLPEQLYMKWEKDMEGLRNKLRETFSEINRRMHPRAPAPEVAVKTALSVSPDSLVQGEEKADTPLSWFSNGSSFVPTPKVVVGGCLSPTQRKSISPSSSSSRGSFNSPIASPISSPSTDVPILRFN